jgi:hypothetical protein
MHRDPAKAIAVLDAMLESFDGGERWMRGDVYDAGKEKACRIGAAVLCAVKPRDKYQIILGEPDHNAYHYLYMAFTKTSAFKRYDDLDRRLDLECYNDLSRSFTRIEKLILAARAIAQAELDAKCERTSTVKQRSVTAPCDSPAREYEAA